MARKITADTLRKAKACKQQLELFERLFPDGVEPTEAIAIEHASAFDWDWAALHLLSDDARRAYHEAKVSAWKAYYEATAPARKAYEEAAALARRAYYEAKVSAWKAYYEACAAARKAYYEACAAAFVRAFNSEEG